MKKRKEETRKENMTGKSWNKGKGEGRKKELKGMEIEQEREETKKKRRVIKRCWKGN